MKSEKCSKTFFKVLERQNRQNETISRLYSMITNQNILAILRTFSNLENKFMKNLAPRRQLPKGEQFSKIFFKALERQNRQNQTISRLYSDDNKSKYSSNPKNISDLENKFMKNFTQRKQLPRLLLLIFFAKFLTERKYLINNLNFVKRKYL